MRHAGRMQLRQGSAAFVMASVTVATGAAAWFIYPAAPPRPSPRILDAITLAADTDRPASIAIITTDPSNFGGGRLFRDDTLLLDFDIQGHQTVQWTITIEYSEAGSISRPPLGMNGRGVTVAHAEKIDDRTWRLSGATTGPSKRSFVANGQDIVRPLEDVAVDGGSSPAAIIALGTVDLSRRLGDAIVTQLPDVKIDSGLTTDKWSAEPLSNVIWGAALIAEGDMVTLEGRTPSNGSPKTWINWGRSTYWVGESLAASRNKSARNFWAGLAAGICASALLLVMEKALEATSNHPASSVFTSAGPASPAQPRLRAHRGKARSRRLAGHWQRQRASLRKGNSDQS